MMALFQALVTGLLFGGVLALLSAGLALIFGVMRVVNFAQGEFVMLGMYTCVWLVAAYGIDPVAAVFPAFLGMAALGWLIHRALLSRVATGDAGRAIGDPHLIMTLGLSLVLQNGALLAIGATPMLVFHPRTVAYMNFAGIVVNEARVLATAIAVVVSVAFFWFLTRTATGKGMRAVSDDPEAATYVGLDVKGLQRLAFALGAGLAGLGGALVGSFQAVQPFVSWNYIVFMFAAVVLGGLGSPYGAAVGGVAIGLAWGVAPLILPLELQMLGVFAVFLLVLFVRPHGLFGFAGRV
jgi:branched-chain amino acid transport system permease protein